MNPIAQHDGAAAPANAKASHEAPAPLTPAARAIWDRSRENANRRFLAAA
ncbi:hypothetical protein [Caballeronia sp. S22]